jgi:choline kinase
MEIPVEVLVNAQRERIAVLVEENARLADEVMQLRAVNGFYADMFTGLQEQAREAAGIHDHDHDHEHDHE